jgi:hypothetical protein
MGEALLYRNTGQDQFKIDYPYYGLFGSAEVTAINNENDIVFKCKLLNGTILYLKKLVQSKKWVDLGVNLETPLASIIGNSIDDFFKSLYK